MPTKQETSQPRVKCIDSSLTVTSRKQKRSEADNELSDQDADLQDENNAKLLAALVHFGGKAPRSSNRSKKFYAERNAVYAEARKNAKDVVQSGITIFDNMRAQLEDLRSQEIGFQKHRDDCASPLRAREGALNALEALYIPVLEETGVVRSEQINEGFRMLENNDPCRQEALKNSSKKARYQLELTSQMEMDAIDAKELIEYTKNLLRGKSSRKF